MATSIPSNPQLIKQIRTSDGDYYLAAACDFLGNDITNTYATKTEISSLSSAMIFKGTLTTGSTLPTAGTNYTGDAYKVIAAGTYGGVSAKVGDLLVCDGSSWVLIPSGDEIYNVMTGASSSTAGASGLVPTPAAGKQSSYLRGDGTWAIPTDTKYSSGIGLTLASNVFKAKLKSETALTSDSSTVTVSKIYPVVTDKSGYLVVGTPAHTHSTTYTPAGTVGSKGTGITASFTGTAASHNHTFTGTETKTGAPVQASATGDQSIEVLTSVENNGSVSLSGGSVTLSGGGVTLSGGAVTATVDSNGVLSFGHTNPTASLTRPTATLNLPTVNYTPPTFNPGSAASTAHKHAVIATGTVENKSITPAGTVGITDPGHNHGFTGTQATITTGNQSA